MGSSYECSCIFRPVDCTTEDEWSLLMSCDNTGGSGDMTCTYLESHGYQVGTSVTNGHSLSYTEEKSIGLELEGLFSANVGHSLTTEYNWSESKEFSESLTIGNEVQFVVAPGHHQMPTKFGDHLPIMASGQNVIKLK